MRMLKLNERKIYYAKRMLTNDIELFLEPIEMCVNPVTMSHSWTIDRIGAIESGKQVFSLPLKEGEGIAIGDRVYVDVVPDFDNYDGSAQDADYVVVGLEKTPNVLSVVVKRLAV